MCKMKKFPQSLLAFFIVLVKEEKIKVLALTIYRILLYLEQLLFWAKYHFLTLKRQFFQKHGFLGNFGRYSYNKYIASRPQKEGSWSNRKKRDRAMKLLVCHQWHRRSTKSRGDQEKIHFHILCSTLVAPSPVGIHLK